MLIFKNRHWILLDSNCKRCLLCISNLGSVLLSLSCQCYMHSPGSSPMRSGLWAPTFWLSPLSHLPSLSSSCSFPVFCPLALQASKTETVSFLWKFYPPLMDLTIFYLFLFFCFKYLVMLWFHISRFMIGIHIFFKTKFSCHYVHHIFILILVLLPSFYLHLPIFLFTYLY